MDELTKSDSRAIADSEWNEYRTWTKLTWAVLITFIFVVFPLVGYLSSLLHWTEKAAFATFAVFAVCYGYANYKLYHVACPRCGKWIYNKPRCRNDFTRYCLHCGLPILAKSLDE
jgi:ribosomal protein L37E